MAYDGKVMRRALQKFEEERRAWEEQEQRRRESVFQRAPRLREIEGELRSTMGRLVSVTFRRGTDPGRKGPPAPCAAAQATGTAVSAGACGAATPGSSKRS